MSNLKKYNAVFTEVFDVKVEELTKLQYKISSEWDSIAFVNLIASIENSFDIVLEADDAIDFTSYNNGKIILSKYNIDI
jgi:acyl carrier protein